MVLLNVLVEQDNVYCPIGEGKIVENYLQGVFTRISQRVAKLNPSKLDVLVIASESLAGVVFTSMNIFRDYLNEGLKKVGRKESCPEDMGLVSCGAIDTSHLIDKAKEFLEESEININYLTNDRLNSSNVIYFLDGS